MRLAIVVTIAVSIFLIVGISAAQKDSQQTMKQTRLKVSNNGRFLVTEDNKPFFWLSDTAWMLRQLAPDDVNLYMSNRVGHGFNVIQVQCGYNVTNYAGEYPFINSDTDTPNEDFWSKMDMIVANARKQGLYIALVPMWGDEYGKAFGSDSAKARRFGNWLGNRYADRSHVLWIVSGEYDAINGFRLPINEVQRTVLNAMAHGLRDAHNGKQLMTIHPGVARTSSIDFHQEDWLDFNMLQSGHIIDCSAYKMPDTDSLISHDYALTPTKPVLDGEPMYEDTPDAVWTVRHVNGTRAEADTMRRKAYWAVFSGACGHTYGHNNVYGFFEPTFPGQMLTLQTNPSGPGQRGSWKIALDAPGATQMKHLRLLMELRPFYKCIPDPTLIVGDAGKGLDHIVTMRASDGSYGMIYLPTGKPVIVDLYKLAGEKFNSWWFDPRDGSVRLEGNFGRSIRQEFKPPVSKYGNDWILVLDDAEKNYKLPSSKTGKL
jgi:hypothetical protein